MKQVGLIVALLWPLSVLAGNLVPNGSFDNELASWQIKFAEAGESWYADNHESISVVKSEAGHKNVLRLNVASQFIADNPGRKVESFPIAVKPGGRYRFSAYARSTGPNCRIMLEGYQWRPDVTPHPNPTIYELRKVYRFEQLFFGKVKGGVMGGVGSSWKRAADTNPQDKLGKLAQATFDKIQFLVVHVVAIGGTVGDLFVDDIALERLN